MLLPKNQSETPLNSAPDHVRRQLLRECWTPRSKRLGTAIVSIAFVSVTLGTWMMWRKLPVDSGPLPLSQSPFLSSVVEPITEVSGYTSNHDGTWTLTIKDSRGVIRDVYLTDGVFTGSGSGDAFSVQGRMTREWLRSGANERALLGLLERWYSHDPEAQKIESIIVDEWDLKEQYEWDVRGKKLAVRMLMELRKRNPSMPSTPQGR